MTVEIEVGDDLYEVSVRHFEPPSPYRWGEPPEGGEIELDDVAILVHGSDLPFAERHRQRVPLDRLLDVYAEDRAIRQPNRDLTRKVALAKLEEECFKHLMDRREEDFDDR